MNFEERCNEMVNVVNRNIKCSASEIRSILARDYSIYDRDVSAVFNLITGEELNKCIVSYKLLGIQKMKLETGCTWDVASKAFGYDEYVTFYRNFTERTGMSPEELFESGIMFEPDAIGKVAEHIDSDAQAGMDWFGRFQDILIDEICNETHISKAKVLEDLDVYLSRCINNQQGVTKEVSLSDDLGTAEIERLNELSKLLGKSMIEIPEPNCMIEDGYIYFNYGKVQAKTIYFGDGYYEDGWYLECYPEKIDEAIENYILDIGFEIYEKNKATGNECDFESYYFRFRSRPSLPVLAFIQMYCKEVRFNTEKIEKHDFFNRKHDKVIDSNLDISDSYLKWLAGKDKIFMFERKWYAAKEAVDIILGERENARAEERKKEERYKLTEMYYSRLHDLSSYLEENNIESINARAKVCDDGILFSYGEAETQDEYIDRFLMEVLGFEISGDTEYRFKGKRISIVWYFILAFASDSIIDERSWRK